MHYIENAVTLAEVAKVTKRTTAEIEAEAASLGLFLGVDWAGRPALGERDARELVTGDARRVREHDVAWQAFQDRCATWTAARDAVVQAALDAAATDPRQGPQKHSEARDAAVAAGRQFESTTPPPTWVDGVEDGVAVRRYSEPGGKPAGLLDKARGPAHRGTAMSREFETADRMRGDGTFPREWGQPLGDRFSEIRAAWVRQKVGEHASLTAHRTLAAKSGRLLSILRRAELEQLRRGPSA